MALHLSGVVFRRQWKPPRLEPWEGPFADPTQRLPQAPDVAARRRAARRRWRVRQRVREAAKLAAARDDAAGSDIADRAVNFYRHKGLKCCRLRTD